MGYMENQMDNLIESGIHQYEEELDKLHEDMSMFINQSGYTWTSKDITDKYVNEYRQGIYVSHTCRIVIEKFKERLEKLY